MFLHGLIYSKEYDYYDYYTLRDAELYIIMIYIT